MTKDQSKIRAGCGTARGKISEFSNPKTNKDFMTLRVELHTRFKFIQHSFVKYTKDSMTISWF
jgi:hypothetical protein